MGVTGPPAPVGSVKPLTWKAGGKRGETSYAFNNSTALNAWTYTGPMTNAQFLQAALEGIASGMLAEHQLVLRPTHVLSPHDLVGLAVLEHTVLVDT